MKKRLSVLIASLAIAVSSGCHYCHLCGEKACQNTNVNDKQMIENMNQVYRFIKDAGHYYIATVEGNQPRVRPFGTIHIFENKLYIQTGRSKNVGKQLEKNSRVEICVLKKDEWIRVSGTLVDDNRKEAKESLLSEYPSLKSMYSPEDNNTMVLYFQPGTATATIYSFSHEPRVLNF